MAGEIIRKGDPTSHNGYVLEGSLSDICMGQPIAYIGHKVYCPKCKGNFPIVEGVTTTTFYGKGVAVAGMKTSCGAVLIATQFTDTVEWSSGNNASRTVDSTSSLSIAHGLNRAFETEGISSHSRDNKGENTDIDDATTFDEQFVLLDDNQEPLAYIEYTVKLPSGELLCGVTDAEGRTARYKTNSEQPLELYIGSLG